MKIEKVLVAAFGVAVLALGLNRKAFADYACPIPDGQVECVCNNGSFPGYDGMCQDGDSADNQSAPDPQPVNTSDPVITTDPTGSIVFVNGERTGTMDTTDLNNPCSKTPGTPACKALQKCVGGMTTALCSNYRPSSPAWFDCLSRNLDRAFTKCSVD